MDKLQELDLSNTKITDETIKKIYEDANKSCSLQRVSLDYTEVTPLSSIVIARSPRANLTERAKRSRASRRTAKEFFTSPNLINLKTLAIRIHGPQEGFVEADDGRYRKRFRGVRVPAGTDKEGIQRIIREHNEEIARKNKACTAFSLAVVSQESLMTLEDFGLETDSVASSFFELCVRCGT